MTFLLYLINGLLFILSLIGEFVIFYSRLAFLSIIKLFKLIKITSQNLFVQIGMKRTNTIAKRRKLSDKKGRKNPIKIPRHFLSYKVPHFQLPKFKIPKLNIKRKHAVKLKSKLKQKEVTIFPAPRHTLLKFKYFILGFLFCFVFVLLPVSLYFFINSLPNPNGLANREIPQTTKLYDRNGKLLYQIYANENRTLVPLSQIPKNLVNATIAIEDKDFYKNPGFDLAAIIRAAIADLSGKPIQGGSTITQQLIKSTLLTPEVSVERKVKEIVLAFWAEHIYTKNQILEMYFNQVPYGGTAWGIEAASETYFGKKVKDLGLAESAFLAGLPQAPTSYSPYGQNPDLWKARQKEVLNRMESLKYITQEEKEEALAENLVFESPQTPIYAPHFVMYVKDLLIKKYGLAMVEKGGLNVVTSLDLNVQNQAQDIVREEVDNDLYLNLTNGAALVTNPKNGDILAMVGSKDYNDPNGGNVNLTTSLRQPGSSIKVVTYSAALSNGFTAATILDDSPVIYRIAGSAPYAPVNYDGSFHGKIPLRLALANSLNIPAVKTLNKIGIPTMVATAKKMGITTWKSPENYGLSLTLGAAEVKMTDMATVYGTLANLGQRVDLNPILKVTDSKSDVLFEKDGVGKTQVLDPGVAYIISNILADNNARSMEFGINSPLNIPGRVISVKTGTTDNKRDNWTIGYTPNLLVAVWVGNNDNSPMSQSLASGITGAAPIWNRIMSSLLPQQSITITPPADIIAKKCGSRIEYFLKGTENLQNCFYQATPSAVPI